MTDVAQTIKRLSPPQRDAIVAIAEFEAAGCARLDSRRRSLFNVATVRRLCRLKLAEAVKDGYTWLRPTAEGCLIAGAIASAKPDACDIDELESLLLHIDENLPGLHEFSALERCAAAKWAAAAHMSASDNIIIVPPKPRCLGGDGRSRV